MTMMKCLILFWETQKTVLIQETALMFGLNFSLTECAEMTKYPIDFGEAIDRKSLERILSMTIVYFWLNLLDQFKNLAHNFGMGIFLMIFSINKTEILKIEILNISLVLFSI